MCSNKTVHLIWLPCCTGSSPTTRHRDRSHSPKPTSQARDSHRQRHRHSPSLSPGGASRVEGRDPSSGPRVHHSDQHGRSHDSPHSEHYSGPYNQGVAPQEYADQHVKQPLRGTGRQLPQLHGNRGHRHNSQAQIHARTGQNTRHSQESLQSSIPKYNFPVNRFLLTRDPKDRSVAGERDWNGLGMRVIGGKDIPGSGGVLGAFVARIYPGGVADRAGDIREDLRMRPGDQVLEWNGVSLTGKTFEEVQSILAQTQTVEEVEVVIRSRHCSSRSGSAPRLDVDQDRDRMRRGSSRHSLDMNGNASVSGSSRDRHGSSSTHDDGRRKYSDADALSVGTGTTEPSGGSGHRGSSVTGFGELSLQVCYDKQAHILYLIVHKARNLPLIHSQGNMIPPDPYVKVYLLPGRNLENQRRTKACSRTQEPEWNQTMVYEGVPPEELPTRYLEVTTWNYDVSKPNPAMGGVLLDLSDTSVLDEEPVWYALMDGPALQAALSRLTSKRTGSVSTSIYGSGTANNVPLHSSIQICSFAALLVLLGLAGIASAGADFTAAESEAAREGLLEALGGAVSSGASRLGELDLPPSISESVRRVAFVRVDTIKEAKNIKLARLDTLHRGGSIGADPIVAGKAVTFTLPLELDKPYLTGDLVRKVNDVGPTGHFNTTIGVYRLEAEGTATVDRDTCSFNFTAIKDIELGDVDTVTEGASLLNSLLSKEMSDAVRGGTLPLREHVSRAILDALEASDKNCLPSLREKLAKVPAPSPAAAAVAAPAPAPAPTSAAA
ncbi:Protein piccolo [Frankliniella fusca]|uniref:Protein piccolo n=1 Tax=Frankliniella fusca TaxID=407009 RepID=A0AAE1LD16_9NEOP|nr:Protein piccolo [Frankliniella fusca]